MKTIAREDVGRAGEILARAFHDDPFMLWLLEGTAPKALGPMCTALVKMYRPKGHSYTTGQGVALWAPPGKWKLSTLQQIRFLPTFLRHMGAAGMRRGGEADAIMRTHHPDQPHWYLSMLGVDPDSQRTGQGGSLLRPMLERADRDGVHAYLETTKDINVPYYQGFGFEVASEVDLPAAGPHAWFMVRRPH